MNRAVLAIAVGTVACVSGTPRPLPPAADFQVEVSPVSAMAAVLQAVSDQGLPLRLHDDALGVVETQFVDLAAYYPAVDVMTLPERLIRFRIIVAPAETGYGSRVLIEARYAPFGAPGGVRRRRNERAIPADHPGMRLVRNLEDFITDRAGS